MLRSIKFASSNSQAISRGLLSRGMSFWANVQMGPADPIIGVNEAFKKDPAEKKYLLGVGAYRDDNGKPYVLSCVRKAEQKLLSENVDKEYLPITGLESFNNAAVKFAYGENSKPLAENRIAVAQSLSGTGSLRVGAAFLQRFLPKGTKVYVPKPTWGNHITIFKDAGMEVCEYRYFDPRTNGLDIAGLLEDLKAAPDGSVILLHGCAHNPTGVDPSKEQWNEILNLSIKKNFLPFLDVAYQGFASGNPVEDAYSLRLFAESGLQMMLAQSFAKNLGLYGERTGAISVICSSPEEKARVLSQLKIVIRSMYSSPPLNGARIADKVMNDPELLSLWYSELKAMSGRIIDMRKSLRDHLENDFNSKLKWNHITDQIGMFCFTGLKPEQVDRIRSEYHIYMTRNGRISVAGLNTKNVKYVAEAFHAVTK
ncbi:hypothetical protein BB560_001173 [Smittium megazygosporum]|uniref:aspartate transaminase n=1 Tax=Smittium megazygosporum TaxID=133381 RepID=A0A2T9ZIB4_9FUNG|nr:hypothetical protein BB560_001173 [Smittium megazygosporum]